ncbi:hypothetical protein D3C76_1355370 [compost metagenome]
MALIEIQHRTTSKVGSTVAFPLEQQIVGSLVRLGVGLDRTDQHRHLAAVRLLALGKAQPGSVIFNRPAVEQLDVFGAGGQG